MKRLVNLTPKPMIAKLTKEFLDYGLKESSAKTYAQVLNQFCEHYDISPYALIELPLEDIEDKTERFIKSKKRQIAPKRMGVFYSAIKAWAHHKHKRKIRKNVRVSKNQIPQTRCKKPCDSASKKGEKICQTLSLIKSIFGMRAHLKENFSSQPFCYHQFLRDLFLSI